VTVILSTFARWQHNMRLYPVEQAFSQFLSKLYEIFKLLSLYYKWNCSVFRLQSHPTEKNQCNCLTLAMAITWGLF